MHLKYILTWKIKVMFDYFTVICAHFLDLAEIGAFYIRSAAEHQRGAPVSTRVLNKIN